MGSIWGSNKGPNGYPLGPAPSPQSGTCRTAATKRTIPWQYPSRKETPPSHRRGTPHGGRDTAVDVEAGVAGEVPLRRRQPHAAERTASGAALGSVAFRGNHSGSTPPRKQVRMETQRPTNTETGINDFPGRGFGYKLALFSTHGSNNAQKEIHPKGRCCFITELV